MKVRVTMKCPDALDMAIEDATQDWLCHVNEDQRDEMEIGKKEELRDKLSKYFQYGEYLTVEFDTLEGTYKIVEQ